MITVKKTLFSEKRFLIKTLFSKNNVMFEYKISSDHSSFFIPQSPHRKNGPAVIHGNSKKWFINLKLHRIDGPAITNDSITHTYWYFNGKRLKEQNYWNT